MIGPQRTLEEDDGSRDPSNRSKVDDSFFLPENLKGVVVPLEFSIVTSAVIGERSWQDRLRLICCGHIAGC